MVALTIPPNTLGALGQLLGAILIALISAVVTVRLAFRRFSAEKNWERRADSYTKIFTAMHRLKTHCDHEIHVLEQDDKLPSGEEYKLERNEILRRLEEGAMEGVAEVQLQVDIGTFVLNKEAVVALRKLLNGLDESIEVWRRNNSLLGHYQFKLSA